MPARSELQVLAEAVVDMLCPQGRVEPTAIAREAGITHSVGSYGDSYDALLEYRHGRFHIYLNRELGNEYEAPRGRFSFCHELGHFFIDQHRWALSGRVSPHGSLTGFTSTNSAEREADFFAACLLMPPSRLRTAAARRPGSADSIRYLADHFGASYSATAIHCAATDVFPMIVMFWGAGGCSWCWSSSKYRELTKNRPRRRISDIPPDSVTSELLRNSSGPLQTKRGTTLSTWFPSISAASNNNEVLVEECLGLGRFGALTILCPDVGARAS